MTEENNYTPKAMMVEKELSPLVMQKVEMPNGVIAYIPLGVHFDETIDDWVINSKENPFPTTDKEVLAKLESLEARMDEGFDTRVIGSYAGKSTEDKTAIAPNAKRGDEFVETDTKEVYFYTTKWEVF